jgi:hypothetical protein
VPLFVEELTKSVLESGELKEAGDHYEYSGPAHAIAIPATLRDSLMARLDRYLPVREVAQIGAAIGREFSYELIPQSLRAPAQLGAPRALTDRGWPSSRGCRGVHLQACWCGRGLRLVAQSRRHTAESLVIEGASRVKGTAPGCWPITSCCGPSSRRFALAGAGSLALRRMALRGYLAPQPNS